MKTYTPLILAIVCAGVLSANADYITIVTGNPDNQGTDNVLFNDSSLIHQGPLIQGNFNGAGAGYIVDFTSAGGELNGSGGQATVVGVGNTPFSNLSFFLEDNATFTKAILNPDATGDGTVKFTVAYFDDLGTPFTKEFDVDRSGQNFFGIFADGGARIKTVTFESSDTTFNNANQFRLGGFASGSDNPGPTVPDGGLTLMLLGCALSACAGVRRLIK